MSMQRIAVRISWHSLSTPKMEDLITICRDRHGNAGWEEVENRENIDVYRMVRHVDWSLLG